jgi:hypothetical protein
MYEMKRVNVNISRLTKKKKVFQERTQKVRFEI